jgi:hypothetical protein
METKQRIYLDEDNKLVVKTDNAIIDGYNKTITSLNGKFTIDANDVAKLLSMINETNMYCYKSIFCSEVRWFIGDEDEHTQHLDSETKLRKEIEKKYNKLIEKIDTFNETRHWWERKIKIDE